MQAYWQMEKKHLDGVVYMTNYVLGGRKVVFDLVHFVFCDEIMVMRCL